MPGFVFVCDARGAPLTPMAPSNARRLMREGKARWIYHNVFSRVQLTQTIAHPSPARTLAQIHLDTSTITVRLVLEGEKRNQCLLEVILDLGIAFFQPRIIFHSTSLSSVNIFRNSEYNLNYGKSLHLSPLVRCSIRGVQQILQELSALTSIKAVIVTTAGKLSSKRMGKLISSRPILPISPVTLKSTSNEEFIQQVTKDTNRVVACMPPLTTADFLCAGREKGVTFTALAQKADDNSHDFWIPTYSQQHGLHWKLLPTMARCKITLSPSKRISFFHCFSI